VRVVIADDDRSMRSKLMAELSRFPGGCEVLQQCRDGSSAIEATLALNPDITLMDVVMSPMGGLDAAKRLVELGRRVLLMTSQGQKGVVEGFDHLIKPYSPHQLHEKLNAIMSRA
jgi:DNA-binding NarL/FixJ family response regulator